MKLHGTMTINEQGHLSIGGCDAVELAREFGTPLYVMDEEHLRAICREYYQSFVTKYPRNEVIYASKAFLTKAMARIIAQEKLGLDVVSGGELYTALEAGFPAEHIYFHGNNKSPEELSLALDSKIGRIIVDNLYELELLEGLCREKGVKAKILLRLQPGIEAIPTNISRPGRLIRSLGWPLPPGRPWR